MDNLENKAKEIIDKDLEEVSGGIPLNRTSCVDEAKTPVKIDGGDKEAHQGSHFVR